MRPMQFMPLIRYMQDTFSDRINQPPTADEWKIVMAYLQVNQIQKNIQAQIAQAVTIATADVQAKADAAVVAVVAALPNAPDDLMAVAAEAAPDSAPVDVAPIDTPVTP